MVFDNELVTEYVSLWKSDGDEETLEFILRLSTPLIEAIASSYGSEHRDDLIQESLIKLHSALLYYDSNVGSMYSYVCAVVRNHCNSYLRKQTHHVDILQELPVYDDIADNSVLIELMVRNRKRFPSIQADVIDEATMLLYDYICENDTKPRGMVLLLMQSFHLSRPVATVMYHSSMVWLRQRYKRFALCKSSDDFQEMTLLPDLEESVGSAAYERIVLLFSGMYLKIP